MEVPIGVLQHSHQDAKGWLWVVHPGVATPNSVVRSWTQIMEETLHSGKR